MLNLKKESLDWALKSALRYYDSYLFPRPFEFDAVKASWTKTRDMLARRDLLDYKTNGVRRYRRVLTAKSRLGFRIATQLDPIDSILTNAALYEIAADLESSRHVPARENSFSFRLKPDKSSGMLFDESYSWKEFHVATRRLAESGAYSFVVVTDIADFYPSVYLHHLETVLYDAVSRSGRHAHAKFLLNYVREMNDSQTHRGLPIGPVFAAPLAELVLDEIDRLLIGNGIPFTRFVDDLRLFCSSEEEAYHKLAYLSQVLYEQRNFKLNEQKTSILSVDKFLERYTRTHEDRQAEGIVQNLEDLLGALDIEADVYADVDVDSLDESDLEKVAELNLEKLFEGELMKKHVDYQFLSFLLGSLAKFDNANVVDILLAPEHVRTLLPRMRSLVDYLNRLRSLSALRRKEIGQTVLERSADPIMGALPFNRAWLFSLFAQSGQWEAIRSCQG